MGIKTISLDDAIKKIDQTIKEIENSGFEVSLIGEIKCHCKEQEPAITGSTIVIHNPRKIRSHILDVADFIDYHELDITLGDSP